jgi:hypothetical protein
MAIQTNLEMWAGDKRVLEYTVVDDDGVVINLTGYDLYWSLRQDQRSEGALISKDNVVGGSGGVAITDASAGEFSVTLDPVDTTAMAGIYFFEAHLEDESDNPVTVSYGFLSIRSAVMSTAYCTLEEALSMAAELDITERTRPNLATSQVIVETIAHDINGILIGRGYTLPITDAYARDYLKSINQYGAVAAILRSKKLNDKGVSGDGGAATYYENKYREGLSNISNPDYNLLSTDTSQETSFSWGGSGLSYDGQSDEPFFRRGMGY